MPEATDHRQGHRVRRNVEDVDLDEVHYEVPIEGTNYHISLQPNRDFVSPAFVIERHRGLGNVSRNRLQLAGHKRHCHFSGTLHKSNNNDNNTFASAQAAISTCNGLVSEVTLVFFHHLVR